MITEKTKDKPVKNVILDILEKEWPLTAKQIYYTIKKQSSRHLTYQAVFKTVKLLEREGILKADKKAYQLNIDYLYDLRESVERKIRSYTLKKMKLEEKFDIPSELSMEVLKFVHDIGPKAEEYLRKDKGTVVIVSGGAHVFGLALLDYLNQKGIKANRVVIDRFSKGIIKSSIYGRKLIVVDSGTHTGRTYKSVMEMLNKVKKEYKIKGIKFAVYFDRSGIADWSCPTAQGAVEFMT